MFFTIYKITNKINNKVYIGKHQTKDLDDGYFGSGKILLAAINKYGIENFSKEILHVFNTEEEMNAKEKELVTEEFCSWSNTYNLCVGGKGGFSYINKNGLQNTPKKNKAAKENFKKCIVAFKTKLANLEFKSFHSRRVSEGLKQKYNEGKLIPPFLGKNHTEKTKEKMRISSVGKQTGSKNSQFGSIWITDGNQNRKINKNQEIPLGFKRGRFISL